MKLPVRSGGGQPLPAIAPLPPRLAQADGWVEKPAHVGLTGAKEIAAAALTRSGGAAWRGLGQELELLRDIAPVFRFGQADEDRLAVGLGLRGLSFPVVRESEAVFDARTAVRAWHGLVCHSGSFAVGDAGGWPLSLASDKNALTQGVPWTGCGLRRR